VPRISVRTLILLTRHLNASLALLAEEVCQSAWGPDADRRAKLLIFKAMDGGQSWTLIYISL
jgi:hypothetical protein